MKKSIEIGQYVKFDFLGKLHYGIVSNTDPDILNIKGIEQKKYTKPAYHLHPEEVQELTHQELIKLLK